jgi:biopolymer transport protein ExbB
MATKWMKGMLAAMLICAVWTAPGAWAQDEAAAPAAAPGGQLELTEEAQAAAQAETSGFLDVVVGAGFLGIVLWLALLACSIAGVALIVDSFITIRSNKISPSSLENNVEESMEQGDVMKALKYCEDDPCPLAHILSSGFSNVQEGFEAIQDAVSVAANLESEKLMQRVTYLNVVGNLAPMLGLLGTVQGMIFAFATLATMQAGAAQTAALAQNISQALYTTAAGLSIAVPAVGFFYYFKNKATRIILGMEGMTMDLIKSLRNVEVVEE